MYFLNFSICYSVQTCFDVIISISFFFFIRFTKLHFILSIRFEEQDLLILSEILALCHFNGPPLGSPSTFSYIFTFFCLPFEFLMCNTSVISSFCAFAHFCLLFKLNFY